MSYVSGQLLLSAAILASLTGCGTNTIFDYSVPTVQVPLGATYGSFPYVQAEASGYSTKYLDRASNVAGSTQIFDVLSIGGGVASVFALIFRASVRELEALAVGTASSVALTSYYSPRVRTLIYYRGASAMRCIANLAGQANTVMTPKQDVIELVFSTASSDQQPVLKPVLDFQFHGPTLLLSAIDTINGKILSDSTSASAAPDISALRTTLISQAQDAVTKQQAFTAAANSTSGGLREARQVSAKDIQPQIDFVAGFDSQVTACIGLAG